MGVLLSSLTMILGAAVVKIVNHAKEVETSEFRLDWKMIGDSTARAENKEVICYYDHGIWCHWKGN